MLDIFLKIQYYAYKQIRKVNRLNHYCYKTIQIKKTCVVIFETNISNLLQESIKYNVILNFKSCTPQSWKKNLIKYLLIRNERLVSKELQNKR